MSEIFLSIVNMSISASWIILAVLVLRLFLKKAPKWINVVLWGVVALRLICPFSFESVLSLIPNPQTINPEIALNSPVIDSGVTIIDNVINPIISEATISIQPEKDINLFQFIMPYLAGVWLVGITALLIYTIISFLRLKGKIGTAVLLRDNVFQSENIGSPFVLGIIKPKIYLPFNIGIQDMVHVIAHENAHIRRKDHLWKPLGFLILALHWFNPLVWLGYVLLCRDIELACDEKVIRELDDEQKADYSQALLTCSVNRRVIAACPLAFGEVGVKKRVKSVLKYKKPALIIVIAAVIVSIIAAVCFLTNPKTTVNEELSLFIDLQVAEHSYSEKTDGNFIVTHNKILGANKTLNKTTVYMWSLYNEYSFENGKIKNETGSHIPTVITVKRTGKHGHYKLVEYWTPRDGSYYAKDIKKKFPWYLHSKALDPQRYIDEQKRFCENSAKEYFASETNKENSSGFGVSKEYSKNGVWLACETVNEGGKPKKSTHFDPTGTKVAEVNYDSEGNKTYTYFYEDGSVAPARTYDISWYENGSYLYRRFHYHNNGNMAMASTYAANDKLTHYYRYNEKGEAIEEKSFNSDTGNEEYHLKMSYRYCRHGKVSEIIFNQGDGSYYQTYYVNEDGKVYRATFSNGSSEDFKEPLIRAGIYFEPIFYDEY